MADDELTLRVPSDLAWDLADEGFEQVEQLRSSDWLSQGVMLAVNVVGATADLTTLILAKGSIAQFALHLTGWATRKTRNEHVNRLAVSFDITYPGSARAQRHFEAEFNSSDEIPDSLRDSMISFIAAALDVGDDSKR
jgi:hypothetical protein